MWSPLASITLWHFRLHEEINLLMSCRVILFHSSWRAFHNCSVVFGFLALECSPRVFYTFSIGLRSGLWGGQSITVTFSILMKFMTTIALWHGALSCMNMVGYLVEFPSSGKTWSFYNLFINSAFNFSWFGPFGAITSPDVIPQTMTLAPPNLILALGHLSDNSSPTFRQTYVYSSEPINKNLDSSLKCTVYHFSWDHNTCSFAKARQHFLFLEDIGGFTTGDLAKSCCLTKLWDTVFLDKGFPSWMLISRETAAVVLNQSFLTNFTLAQSSLLIIILGLPVDFLASDKP